MIDAETYLYALPRFADQGVDAYQPGLERMHALLEAMGHPEERFPSVHIAGTNGKGSTASLLAAIGTATGRRVGLHTSPHLFHVTERMRIDGVPAPRAWLDDAVTRYRPAFDAVQPSFFEATVALSFRYFAEYGAELVVVEVGLGGRLDATNVITPELCLITQIGYDHADVLGDSLEAIAREKGGIIKPGIPVLSASQAPEVLDALRTIATARNAPFENVHGTTHARSMQSSPAGLHLTLSTLLRLYRGLHVALPGTHQHHNVRLAVRAAEWLFEEVRRSSDAVYAGARGVRTLAGLRGRVEVLQRRPLLVADVAHNADGIRQGVRFVREQIGDGDLFVLLGLMRDKDADAIADVLAEAGAHVFVAALPTSRAWPAEALADYLVHRGLAIAGRGRVSEGLTWFHAHAAPTDGLLLTGSHQTVAQVPEAWFVRASGTSEAPGLAETE